MKCIPSQLGVSRPFLCEYLFLSSISYLCVLFLKAGIFGFCELIQANVQGLVMPLPSVSVCKNVHQSIMTAMAAAPGLFHNVPPLHFNYDLLFYFANIIEVLGEIILIDHEKRERNKCFLCRHHGPGTVVGVWTVIELGPFSLWDGYYFGLQMNQLRAGVLQCVHL